MGQSTDAILAFGVGLGDEDGFPDWLSAASGITEDEVADYDFSTAEKWLSERGLCLIHHCSSECTMYVLAINGTETCAWRGTVKDVTLTPPDADEVAKVWAHVREFVKEEPRWVLFSWWG